MFSSSFSFPIFASSKELAGEGVIVIACCAYSLYPGICSVLFSLGITSFSANHRLGLASINSASGARIFQSVRSQSVSQLFNSVRLMLFFCMYIKRDHRIFDLGFPSILEPWANASLA